MFLTAVEDNTVFSAFFFFPVLSHQNLGLTFYMRKSTFTNGDRVILEKCVCAVLERNLYILLPYILHYASI